MTSRHYAIALFGCLALATSAQAQTYPSKTVTLVVTAAAGGVSDVIARHCFIKFANVFPAEISTAYKTHNLFLKVRNSM